MKKTLFTKAMTFSAAFALAATAFTTHTFAATSDVTGSVQGGSLLGGNIATFTPVPLTLTGKDNAASTQAVEWDIDEITDATGSGNGWTYKINVGAFVEANPVAGQAAKQLEGAELLVASVPTIVKAADAGSSSELLTITTNVNLNDSLSSGSGIIFTAAENGGMGSYEIGNLGVKLTGVKANAFAKTYKTDVTITLESNDTTL